MKYNTFKPQTVKTFIGIRTVIFLGRCAVCNRTLYGFDDEHSPDPRGVISPFHTYYPLNPGDYGMTGNDVCVCWDCQNTRETYERGVKIATRQWTPLDTTV